MSVSVTMPRLGESVTEGTVTRWLKKEGDHVEADEPLLEVSTDKVDTEIPSPSSGVLLSIKVSEDETVEVGAELATIDESGAGAGGGAAAPAAEAERPTPPGPDESAPDESAPDASAPDASAAPEFGQPEDARPAGEEATDQPAAEAAQPATAQPEQPAAQPERPAEEAPERPAAEARQPAGLGDKPGQVDANGAYLTPLVRKLAAEHGVDLSSITGSGVGGRIRKQDILDAARAQRGPQAPADVPATAAEAAAQPAPARGRTEKMSRMRAMIAERMVDSLQVSAQLTTVVEADITRIARLRAQARSSFEAREGVELSFLPFFALSTVEALKAHPKVNASIDQAAGTITHHEAEHLGIAVDTDRGLLVPVIRQAGDLNLGGLARKIADLAERTRAGKVSPDELSGGTFTLTNTGSRGALFDTPIILQPQVGILGTGAVVKRPSVLEDPELGEVIAVRSIVYLALTYDHRLVDGADAARFLTTIKGRLEEGAFEADLGL